jgi:predicted small metal-binding protein
MPKSRANSGTRNPPPPNPNLRSHDGGINPSAPATGTEDWGNTADERRVVSTNDPAGTRAGQKREMNRALDDNMTEAVRQASERATTNKHPEDHPGYDQADRSRSSSASAYSMNTRHGRPDLTFRCADAGNADCRWETSGSTEDEIMRRAEEHGRRDHGMTDWTQAMRNRVRDNIHRREAA